MRPAGRWFGAALFGCVTLAGAAGQVAKQRPGLAWDKEPCAAGLVAPALAVHDACRAFENAIKTTPRLRLSRTNRLAHDGFARACRPACVIDGMGSLKALGETTPWERPGQELIGKAGWRADPELAADGAGSGVYGLSKGGITCFVSHLTEHDDSAAEAEPDEYLVRVACMERPARR